MVHLVKGSLLWAVAKYDGYVTNFLFFFFCFENVKLVCQLKIKAIPLKSDYLF